MRPALILGKITAADLLGQDHLPPGGKSLSGQIFVHKLVGELPPLKSPSGLLFLLLVATSCGGEVVRYVGEKIQYESVAMETAGITVIRKGKSRTSWKGAQV